MNNKNRSFYPVFIVCMFASFTACAVEMEEQIKFNIPGPAAFDAVKKHDKILTYKSNHSGEYIYEDYYYDTPDFALYHLGWSYRFRVRNKGGSMEYGVQFKHEYDANSSGYKRDEIDDVIPEEKAKQILAGNWSSAFTDDANFVSIRRFCDFLTKNNIDSKQLTPVIFGKQFRSRYRLKEGDKFYFEVSLDDSIYETIKNKKNLPKSSMHIYQIEFENKYRKDQSSIPQRIKNLIGFFQEQCGAKLEWDSKYRMSVNKLFQEPLKDTASLK
jgi:hypothetical protein